MRRLRLSNSLIILLLIVIVIDGTIHHDHAVRITRDAGLDARAAGGCPHLGPDAGETTLLPAGVDASADEQAGEEDGDDEDDAEGHEEDGVVEERRVGWVAGEDGWGDGHRGGAFVVTDEFGEVDRSHG